MPLCGEPQLALPVLRLTELGRPADNEGDEGRGRGNELCLSARGRTTHEPKLIHDAGQRERIESGLDSSKRRNRDPLNHAHKSHIMEKKHDKKYVSYKVQVNT